MFVDSHAHVFEVGLPLAKIRRYVPTYDAKSAQFIQHLDDHNIGLGVLIQPSFLGTDNSYMLSAIKTYPDRLYGVAVIEPNMPFEEMKKLSAQKIIGIRLNLYGVELPDLTTSVWQSCLANIKQLGWHVELHYDAKRLKPFIDILLKAGVKIVVDHFGKPDIVQQEKDEDFQYLLSLAQTKQIWVKVSACYRLNGLEKGKQIAKKLFNELLKKYSAHRLLWGSDWPHTQYESEANYRNMWDIFVDMVPDEKTQEIILSKSFIDLIS